MSGEQQPTGASIKSHRDLILEAVRANVKTIDLRKWCVEHAIKADCSTVEGVELLTKFFYSFVTSEEPKNDKESA
jgi:hypothetical protein